MLLQESFLLNAFNCQPVSPFEYTLSWGKQKPDTWHSKWNSIKVLHIFAHKNSTLDVREAKLWLHFVMVVHDLHGIIIMSHSLHFFFFFLKTVWHTLTHRPHLANERHLKLRTQVLRDSYRQLSPLNILSQSGHGEVLYSVMDIWFSPTQTLGLSSLISLSPWQTYVRFCWQRNAYSPTQKRQLQDSSISTHAQTGPFFLKCHRAVVVMCASDKTLLPGL